jgi:hypothetical protein
MLGAYSVVLSSNPTSYHLYCDFEQITLLSVP